MGAIWGHCEACSGLITSDFKSLQKKRPCGQVPSNGLQQLHCHHPQDGAQGQLRFDQGPQFHADEDGMLGHGVCHRRRAPADEGGEGHQHDDYKEAIEAAMDDPTSGTQMAGRVYAQEELQYLTVICEGFTQSFCFRRTECMFFGAIKKWHRPHHI
jgi:hypothetical protein